MLILGIQITLDRNCVW